MCNSETGHCLGHWFGYLCRLQMFHLVSLPQGDNYHSSSFEFLSVCGHMFIGTTVQGAVTKLYRCGCGLTHDY